MMTTAPLLTFWDVQLLQQFDAGKDTRQTADALGLQVDTVRGRFRRILDKAGVETRREALEWARANGVLQGEQTA